MGSGCIIAVDPWSHGVGSFGRGLVGHGINPFAQGGLDKALGLAIGFRGIGPCAQVAQAGLFQEIAEDMAFIGGSVVAHDTLDSDAVPGEEREGVLEEASGAFLGLIGQDFGIGEARGIVDGDVKGFPAGAALSALTPPVAGDPMADAVDLSELLAVDMDEFAWPFALVAEDGRFDVETVKATEAQAAEHGSDGGAGKAEAIGDGLARHPRAPEPFDRSERLGRQSLPRPGGRRAPVAKHPLAARPEPSQPFVDGACADACCLGGVGDPPPFADDPVHKNDSTIKRHTGILVDVHPGAPGRAGWIRKPQLHTQASDEQPL